MSLLGIYREPEFSPGRHTSNDALILRLVGQALERLNVPVRLATLDEARDNWRDAEGIFSMCQGPDALAELLEWKKQGARILNEPAASLRTYRETLVKTLSQQGVRFPKSLLLKTDGSADVESARPMLQTGGGWLKRSNVHATRPEDVVRLQNAEDLPRALAAFKERSLPNAILQENIPGDEVKFYAVQGGLFFWPYYPKDCVGYPFDEHALEAIAESAARALNLSVYGGDAIISPDGTITLIDVNDWPSFAPCRGAAAHAIARFLKESYANKNSRKTAKI